MTDTAYNVGPGTIADPGTPNGPPFALSKTEWVAIQTYVTNALSLPVNDAQFRNSLGSGAPSDLSDFQPLIAAYQQINGHCTTWQNTTFPATVSLASDIVEYGRNKVPIYYPPILDEARILQQDPGNEQAKEALKAILDVLQGAASGYAKRASDVATKIQEFADQTQADKSTLIGPNGDAGLTKHYADKYGSTSQEVEDLTKEIKAQRLILDGANAEYDQDVIIASTTPTYAWVFPIGTIAAAVVAGIYGHKAVEALDRARAAQDKINLLQDKIAADANLMNAIYLANNGMQSISRALSAALPVIQKIQGIWGGISADLGSIVTLIDTDIRQVPPIIMGLGVDEAVRAWANVAQAADAYRINAYVKDAGPASLSMHAWRLRSLVSSRPAAQRLLAA